MASLKCTGPAYIYVGVGAGYAPVYLGTAEKSPNIDVQKNYKGLSNDIGGEEPIDDIYQGQSALIDLGTNRWTEAVYAALEKTNPFSNTPRGTDDPGDIGSIMQLEGKAFPVWVQFPYVAKAVMDIPAGYRFMSNIMVTDRKDTQGTTDNQRIRLAFKARRLIVPFSAGAVLVAGGGAAAGAVRTSPLLRLLRNAVPGSHVLFDHDMTGLPGPS